MRATRSRALRRAAWTTSTGLVLAALVTTGSAPALAASGDDVAEQPVGTTRLISRGFDGTPAEDDSRDASVSDDGRYVAFSSVATDIVPDPSCDPDFGCVYVHDRLTRATELVSISPTGKAPNGDVSEPNISGDGRYVAYDSEATNLVPGDRNRRRDVFVYDRQTATTTLISRNPDGDPADHGSGGPVLTPDGRFVLYKSRARDLVPGDRRFGTDVYRHDRVTDTTIVVSLTPRGKRPNDESWAYDLSADGRVAAFLSHADNIVRGDDNELWDVFAFDAETGTTELISRATDGTVAAGNSGSASISYDGRFITFWSDASDIVPPDSLGHYDVFRLDRVTGEMVLVSRGLDGGPANGSSGPSTISADGSLVAFASAATDLVPDDDDGDVNGIFVADLVAGTTSELTTGRRGEPTDGRSTYPFLSGSGNVVAFESEATNLVRRDRNDADDVFLYRRR